MKTHWINLPVIYKSNQYLCERAGKVDLTLCHSDVLIELLHALC